MKEFVYIPVEKWPKESEHVEYDPVYRAIKNDDKLTPEDFQPWNVEHKNQAKLFRNQFRQPEYGMSVFTELYSLISVLQKVPSLKAKTKGIAKGRTNIDRGISTRENKEHHVEYYLYDYVNNNPKDDFSICVLSSELEQMVSEND